MNNTKGPLSIAYAQRLLFKTLVKCIIFNLYFFVDILEKFPQLENVNQVPTQKKSSIVNKIQNDLQ